MATVRSRRAITPLLALALLATALVAAVGSAAPADAQSPRFSDLDQTLHAEAIELVAADGITTGCGDGTRFCPRDDVRRDQMATFIAKALRLNDAPSRFPDVPRDNTHYGAIGAIAAADITRGFNDGTYRPREFVTRGQMATFLAKGLDLPPGRATFRDVPTDYAHADAIAAIADAGITSGYGDGTFRPNALVKRDQMAAFLANGIPLPREPRDACNPTATSTRSSATDPEATTHEQGEAETSEDLAELEEDDRLATSGSEQRTAADDHVPPAEDLGPAVPGLNFPVNSALRTTAGSLELHTLGLNPSRGARVDDDGEVTATTRIPQGTRTWATAQLGDWVYVGQWGPSHGGLNLFRYRADVPVGVDRRADADAPAHRVEAVAAVPSGGEFWTLASDGRYLWAGTRAHLNGDFRASVGLGTLWSNDARHAIHRIDPVTRHQVDVLFCTPNLPAGHDGSRPDVKQIAAADGTLYVGLGQQAGSTRLYAFEPGNRTDIPYEAVRDLTPTGVAGSNAIFAMTADTRNAADARYLAFGTQAASGVDARLVVIDRSSEQVRANVRLPGESRVDAVAVRGDRVVATGNSGTIYEIRNVPRTGSAATTATSHEFPLPNQFSRYVEIAPDGSLRGVTSLGIVWTRGTNGEYETQVLGDDPRVPAGPGQPHSLHAGTAEIVVGSNSAVAMRPVDDPSAEPRMVGIAGEAKAATSDAAGTTYVATYPGARLYRVAPGAEEAELVRRWREEFTRPADAGFDDRTGRALVVARHEAGPVTETRTGDQANFQYRPSRLFSIDPSSTSTTRVEGWPLRRGPSTTSAAVEASELLVGDTPGGSEVYVGDTFGGVQRVDGLAGTQSWYRPPHPDDRDRKIAGLDLVDGELIVVTSDVLNRRGGGTYAPRTVITRLDPTTGVVIQRRPLSSTYAVGDAITIGDVTVMSTASQVRYFDRVRQEDPYCNVPHPSADVFGRASVAVGEDGALFHFARTPTHLVRHAPENVAACLPPVEDDPLPLP